MVIEAPNFQTFKESLESLLDRFTHGRSIRLENFDPPKLESQKSRLTYVLPRETTVKTIRESWQRDRRKLPESGIVFEDGSVMTVLFQCSKLPTSKLPKPILKEVSVCDAKGEPFAYVERYSYCFYPNSEKAEEIGYFRYDFHPESMGEDGDLGDHTYFHMHHRKINEDFRLPTGPVLEFDKLVGACEKTLSPAKRKTRLEKTFKSGDFDKLFLDMTFHGIMNFKDRLFPSKLWNSFPHREKYESFIRKHNV